MNIDKLSSAISRVFFFTAMLLVLLAVIDRLLNWFGYTVLPGPYTPGRLLQYAGAFMIFVVALLLREVREEIKKRPA